MRTVAIFQSDGSAKLTAKFSPDADLVRIAALALQAVIAEGGSVDDALATLSRLRFSDPYDVPPPVVLSGNVG